MGLSKSIKVSAQEMSFCKASQDESGVALLHVLAHETPKAQSTVAKRLEVYYNAYYCFPRRCGNNVHKPKAFMRKVLLPQTRQTMRTFMRVTSDY
jgi:hypothetical protein